MARLNMTMKKKIGIPAAVAMFCLSKALGEVPIVNGMFLLLAIMIFLFTVYEEYMEARLSIKILLGVIIGGLVYICIGTMLPYDVGFFNGDVAFIILLIILGAGILTFGILVLDDVKLYFNLKKDKEE